MKRTIDDLHIITLHAGYAEMDKDWNWKNVRSPFARLYYVTEGTAKVIIHAKDSQEDETITLRAGHLYFIPPFTLHSNVCEGVFKHYYIHVLENTTKSFHYLTEYIYPREVEATPLDLELFQEICNINPFLSLTASNPETYDNDQSLLHSIGLGKQRPLCDKIESRGILYILMSRFMRNAKRVNTISDKRILHAIDYIEAHINQNVSIYKLAEMEAMSKDHFIRTFKKETGMTPNSFAIKRKMERAETLLIATDMPIKAIATKMGYDDSTYFHRMFKQTVGKTPQQYRTGGRHDEPESNNTIE